MLVDSSVWIEVLRGRNHERFRDVTANRTLVTCLPVVQEVLQGFDSDSALRLARLAFTDMRIVESPLTADIYEEAIELYRTARRRGFTVRSGVDCLIAVCAIRNGVPVLHQDRDFEALAHVSSLVAVRF